MDRLSYEHELHAVLEARGRSGIASISSSPGGICVWRISRAPNA
ncbi:MAG: hypothetical protein ACR2L9_13765 [Solirubrobacteraceae bacterium]